MKQMQQKQTPQCTVKAWKIQ